METPSAGEAGGVCAWRCSESERRVVERGSRVRVGMHEVVVGALFVEAMDLGAVVRFEEMKEFVEEVVDLDDGLIGDRR
jgi:hypothetical protein